MIDKDFDIILVFYQRNTVVVFQSKLENIKFLYAYVSKVIAKIVVAKFLRTGCLNEFNGQNNEI